MYNNDYERWAGMELEDPALSAELTAIAGNEEEIKERFAVALKFGTAGLRGVLGAGSNRMNIYVVRQATQGLANWVTVMYLQKKQQKFLQQMELRFAFMMCLCQFLH